jgi:uncharacterized membrane protein
MRLFTSADTVPGMATNRLEAFSDGVLAIIITIMVLELKAPEGPHLSDLEPTLSGLGTYLLSFVYVGIYWNNHHHMFQLTRRVSGGVLWANLALLFCISLFPFSTAWMDESGFARSPVVVYGVNLLAAAISYYVLQQLIIRTEGDGSVLREAVGRDLKGKLSPVLYISGIALSFVSPWLGIALYTVVAVMWLVPDRRLEGYVREHAISE